MKKIVYTRPDGGVSVVNPAAGARLAFAATLPDGTVIRSESIVHVAATEVKDAHDIVTPIAIPADQILRPWPADGKAEWAESEDQFIARISPKSIPKDAKDVRIVEGAELPLDYTFRNAWRQAGGKVEVDMPKAVEICKVRLREWRTPQLEALDKQVRRAEREKKPIDEIDAKYQPLLDVTDHPSITAAKTPEALLGALAALTKESP